jgi:hypothetical protein
MTDKNVESIAAEKKLANAIREYLWEQVQISGEPRWETDAEWMALAVSRVVGKVLRKELEDENA